MINRYRIAQKKGSEKVWTSAIEGLEKLWGEKGRAERRGEDKDGRDEGISTRLDLHFGAVLPVQAG